MPHAASVVGVKSHGYDTVVSVALGGSPDDGQVEYVAAAPPDYRGSFAGSGLPYKDAQQAFYATPNRGTASVGAGGTVEVRLRSPGSYYAGFGTVLVPPTLHLSYTSGGRHVSEAVRLGHGVPFRSLTYPPARRGPAFYAAPAAHAAVRSQEAILLASAYPDANMEPGDFWGGRPAR